MARICRQVPTRPPRPGDMNRPRESNYLVAGCRPWSRLVLDERVSDLPGRWHFAKDREALMRLLVLAAHPDDEVLGCGGTMARLAAERAEVHVYILREGVTSRYDSRELADETLLRALQEESREARRLLGVDEVEQHGLPDNRFDAEALLDVIKVVEKLIGRIDPEVIYTHHGGDLNIDHRIVHQAVLVAARPVTSGGIRDVYAWEVPSSTNGLSTRSNPASGPTSSLISATRSTKRLKR